VCRASSAGPARAGRAADIGELTEGADVLPTLIDLCGLKAAGRSKVRRRQSRRAAGAARSPRWPIGCSSASSAAMDKRSRQGERGGDVEGAGGWCRQRTGTTSPPIRAEVDVIAKHPTSPRRSGILRAVVGGGVTAGERVLGDHHRAPIRRTRRSFRRPTGPTASSTSQRRCDRAGQEWAVARWKWPGPANMRSRCAAGL